MLFLNLNGSLPLIFALCKTMDFRDSKPLITFFIKLHFTFTFLSIALVRILMFRRDMLSLNAGQRQ